MELRVDGLLSWGDAMLHFLLPRQHRKKRGWRNKKEEPVITTLQLDLLPRNLDARKLNRLAQAVQKSHSTTITTVKFHIPQAYQEHDYNQGDNDNDNGWTGWQNNHNNQDSTDDPATEDFYFTDAVYHLFGELGRLPTLKVLKIGCCKDTNSNIVAARALDVGALGAVLKEAKGLERLEIQQIILDGTDSGFAGLCRAVQEHPTLTSVSLLDCYPSSPDEDDENDISRNSSEDDKKRSKMEQLLLAFSQCRTLQELEVTNPGGDASVLGRFWCTESFRRLCNSQSGLQKLVINGFEGLQLQDCSSRNGDDTNHDKSDHDDCAVSNDCSRGNNTPSQGLTTYANTTGSPFLAMTRGLKDNCCLKELAVSCTLGEADFRALAQFLRGKNESLEELTLNFYPANDSNPLTDEVKFQRSLHKSILEVAEALQDNTHLKCLALRGIGDPTRYGMVTTLLRAFAQALEVNYSLEKLCWSYRCPPLSTTTSSWESCDKDKDDDEDHVLYSQILHRLKLNQNGRGRLLRAESAGREEWVNALVNVRHDASCLFDFLSLNPLVCVSSCESAPLVTACQTPTHQFATVVSEECLVRMMEARVDHGYWSGSTEDSQNEVESLYKKRRIT